MNNKRAMIALESLCSQHDNLDQGLDQLLSNIYAKTDNVLAVEEISEIIDDNNNISPLVSETLRICLSSLQGNVADNIALEEAKEYTSKAVEFINSDAKSISDWLSKLIEGIDKRSDEYLSKSTDLSKRIKEVKKTNTDKTLTYTSIVRNLSIGLKVKPDQLVQAIDIEMIRIISIIESSQSKEFIKLLDLLETYEVSTEEKDTNLQEVFKACRNFYKSFLSHKQTVSVYDLELFSGRELWMDKRVYLGGKVYYSYCPTELSDSSGNLWSGFVRTTKQDLDLKMEFAALSKSQCSDVLKTINRYVPRLDKSKAIVGVSYRLLDIIRRFSDQYKLSKGQRKVSAKPYILLMNLSVSLLYGIQVKAFSQAESIVKACLKYVDKSVSALEENPTQ